MKTRWLILLSCVLLTACDNSKTEPTPKAEDTAESADATTTADGDAKVTDAEPAAPTTADQLEAIKSEFDEVMSAFSKKYREAAPEARQALLEERPAAEEFARKMLALAESDESIAVDALDWVMSRARGTEVAEEAQDLMFANHIDSPRLQAACMLMAYAPASKQEQVTSKLNKAIEQSPHEDVKAAATYALANFTSSLPDANEADVKSLYEKLAGSFGKLKPSARSKRTYGEMAKAAIFEMENLKIGKIVPEIEAEDLDGVTFKLSDYRGKVVLIDFWGDW